MRTDRRKEAAVCLLAFLIPAAAMLWAFARLGMAPWGDKTVLISDMADQYAEFFCALKYGDLFFSWSKALGTSYIGVFSYYVSSPLSALTLLFPNEEMPMALLLLTVLKLGLAGAAFAFFVLRRFPGSGLTALLCGVSWALMSYNAAYCLCIMWLDGVIWLPLILLALERVLAGRGWGPFAAALSVCFLSCWYISYMIGGFCLLYFIARCVMLRPGRRAFLRAFGRFAGGAACALGLTAWLWLPTFLAMFAGKFSGGNAGYGGLFTAAPPDLLARLWDGSYTSITWSALPYTFCGTAALVLAALYFFQRHPLREKLAYLALAAAVALSLLLSPLDKAWHLFQRPNWFPYRYAFLFSCALLLMAAQALPPVLAGLRRKGAAVPAKALTVLLVAAAVLELSLNALGVLRGLDGQFRYQSGAAYRADYAANAALVSAARADAGEGFFRMGAAEDRGHNGPLAFGYAGITHYSSLYNYDVNRLLKSLGFAQSWMWCASYGSTPVTDALLDLRYTISRGPMPYEAAAEADGYTLYENPDVLPVAFLSAGAAAPVLSAATPFERQNDLLAALAGEGTAPFAPVRAEAAFWDGAAEFTFTGTGQPVYADLSASGLIEVRAPGLPSLSLGATETACVHYLGSPAPGETYTVTVFHDGTWVPPESFLWALDREALSAAVGAAEVPGALSVEKSGRVALRVTADFPRALLTTIPAEDGWSVRVDGRRAEPGVWLDTFLSVPMDAGEHTVELRYTAPGLIPGAALGALAAVVLTGAAVLKKRRGQ